MKSLAQRFNEALLAADLSKKELGEGDMQLPEGSQLEEAQSLLKQMPASNLTAVTTILKQLSEINKI